MLTPSESKNKGIIKFEFVAKTQLTSSKKDPFQP